MLLQKCYRGFLQIFIRMAQQIRGANESSSLQQHTCYNQQNRYKIVNTQLNSIILQEAFYLTSINHRVQICCSTKIYVLLIFLMKPFFQIKPSFDNERDSLCLPQLRTKSMSIPTNKLHNNYNRYHHRNFLDSASPNKKWVINLEEIQRKGQSQLSPAKVNIANDRKKLLSQYETIDLWKQKHHPQILANYQKRLHMLKQIPQSDGAKSSLELNIEKNEKKFSQLLRMNSNNNNNSQIKILKRDEKQKDIPDQFLIKRINAYSKLRKDEKLEMILKRDSNNESNINMRKSYKSSLPVFDKQVPVIKQKRKSDFDNNPSKWQISKQYTQEDQLMQN